MGWDIAEHYVMWWADLLNETFHFKPGWELSGNCNSVLTASLKGGRPWCQTQGTIFKVMRTHLYPLIIITQIL
jgi:hypothetical protein